VISKKGEIYKLNPNLSLYYTWHAGTSKWGVYKSVNPISFGIEQEHLQGDKWTDEQVRACAEVCHYLCDRFSRGDRLAILSHAAVATPKGRKTDPENYPWRLFSQYFHEYDEQ